MKKMMLVAVVCLVLGAVIGSIVLLGGEEKVVPQAKIAKVTITCEPLRNSFDYDCDAVGDNLDNCPFVTNPVVSGIGQPDRDRDGIGDACDPVADETDALVTIRISSSDSRPAEMWLYHAIDSSDPSQSDVSYGVGPFEVKLTKDQACDHGIEINARRVENRDEMAWQWYCDLGILESLSVTLNGQRVTPARVKHPWSCENLQLTRQMLGCNS